MSLTKKCTSLFVVRKYCRRFKITTKGHEECSVSLMHTYPSHSKSKIIRLGNWSNQITFRGTLFHFHDLNGNFIRKQKSCSLSSKSKVRISFPYINFLSKEPMSYARYFHTCKMLHKNILEKDHIDIESKKLQEYGESATNISINNDPELQQILKDIRKDFNDEESSNCHDDDEQPDKIGLECSVDEVSTKEMHVPTSRKDDGDFSYYEVAGDIEEYEYLNEIDILPQQTPHEKDVPISLERGQTGVFDLDELVILLQELGCVDVVDFPIPPEYNFCDNMVVASAKSMRHMRALHEEIYWIYKRKKGPDDPYIQISGTDDTFWCAMDMGNIVVHIFYGDARQYYDIESLWTGVPGGSVDQEVSKYELSPEDLFWLETQGDKTDKDRDSKDNS